MKLLPTMLVLSLVCLGCGHKPRIEYGGKTLRQWEWKAVSPKTEDRVAAAKAFGEIGPKKAMRPLVQLLSDRDKTVKFAASLAVMKMGKTAVPYLTDLLQDPDQEIRANASKALVQNLMDMRADGVTQLTELLRDPDPSVRVSAAKSLVMAGSKAKEAIPALEEASKDENPKVRKAVAMTLQALKEQKGKSKVPPVPFVTPPSK